jgi:sulfofructose kinase
VNLDHVQMRKGCSNQSAYILIDQTTGERTVFWNRSDCPRLNASEITEEQFVCARMLHIDGHDTDAVAHAARIARRHGIPVTADVDTIYKGFDEVLPNVDYLVTSSEFPERWTGERDPFRALALLQDTFGMKVTGMTLGAQGALVRSGGRFFYSPAFVVNCIDTTGAGDIFHGAFCYAILKGMEIPEALDFSNAMAALNCTSLGARGGIKFEVEARALIARGERRVAREFEKYRC